MAALKLSKENSGASCYIWLSIALTILGVFFIGTASFKAWFFDIGITLIVLAITCACLWIIRAVIMNKLNNNTEHAEHSCCCCCCNKHCCNCCDCCSRCCKKFWFTILCIQEKRLRPTLAISRNDPRQISVIEHSGNTTESEAPTSLVVVNEIGHTNPVAEADNNIEDEITNLDNEIKKLRQQYEFLKRQEFIEDLLNEDYMHLDIESAKMTTWITNEVQPSKLELKTMKGRLRIISTNFRNARNRTAPQDENPSEAVTASGIRVDVDMNAPEQVRVFAQNIPLPPEYSAEDAEPNATERFKRANPTTPPVYTEHLNSEGPWVSAISSDGPQGPPHTPISPDGTYENTAFLGERYTFEPHTPIDNSSAPPAYHE